MTHHEDQVKYRNHQAECNLSPDMGAFLEQYYEGASAKKY